MKREDQETHDLLVVLMVCLALVSLAVLVACLGDPRPMSERNASYPQGHSVGGGRLR